MNYNDAVAYIHSLGELGWKPGLDRMTALCERLGNPPDKLKCIHVGGTNGKGSTAAMVTSILQKAGYRVGSYFSPYVYDIRERVQINGEMIDRESFARLVGVLKTHADAMADTELGHPTEFEVKTALGFLYFAEQNVDFAVLEVGLGGRLDATNVVNPLVSVIANVTMDHNAWLGDTIAEIASEKAGIIKPNTPVITASSDPEVLEIIKQTCREKNSVLWHVFSSVEGTYAEHEGKFTKLPKFKTGMLGDFQRVNAATAAAVALVLREQGFPIDDDTIAEGLESAYIPGRLEVLRTKPTLLIDGAHNIDAAEKLAEFLETNARFKRFERLILVMGMVSGHSIDDVVGTLAPLADKFIATSPSNERAAPASEVADIARSYCQDVTEITPVRAAVKAALAEADEDDLICVTGSFYTIGEVPRP